MDYRKYSNLETYLFEEVGSKFRKDGTLEPLDLYLLLTWKANRAKNKTKRRLAKKGDGFANATSQIAGAIYSAKSPEERLEVLMKTWGMRLPTATAILSVLYPEEFTVYDWRVCSQLGEYGNLNHLRFSKSLWAGYKKYRESVEGSVSEEMSLRDKDKYLWGKSLYEDAVKNVT